jgi:hypothetical protein
MSGYAPKPRRWNGYGLSFWSCKCGARRKVTSIRANDERIVGVNATPCKRCGDTGEPVGWPSDPWLGFDDGYAEDPLGGSWS